MNNSKLSKARFKAIMRFSLLFALGISAVMTGLCYLLRGQIVGAFLTEPDAFDYAVRFTNILLTTSFLFGVTGLAWAQPVADLLSTSLVVALYWRTVRKLFASVD